MKLIIGTRGSALALWQAEHVKERLLALPGRPVSQVELQVIKTRGDKILDVTLSRVGGKGLFVKELEQALLDGEVDLAVHSLKDMPSALPAGLCLSAFTERADPRDAWVLPEGSPRRTLAELPAGTTVATASLRRQAQVLASRPDLRVVPVRGNVGTRLAKLDRAEDGMEAMVLACAGLQRLGLESRISHAFEPHEMLPAVGQGALALECREDDVSTGELLAQLEHSETRHCVLAERALLRTLEGGCQVPIAAHAVVNQGRLHLEGLVASPDGVEVYRERSAGELEEAEQMGVAMAELLLERGAGPILAALATEGSHGG
ncbi:MAG: hydroxymethylbilane synthase [Myxococcota bacterium]|nr:hydroxymethylbilane synthase [Myxococcota bacterium]MEE2780063.1 hydroxymethylbilane synthase [Myxococcota bacterium]